MMGTLEEQSCRWLPSESAPWTLCWAYSKSVEIASAQRAHRLRADHHAGVFNHPEHLTYTFMNATNEIPDQPVRPDRTSSHTLSTPSNPSSSRCWSHRRRCAHPVTRRR